MRLRAALVVKPVQLTGRHFQARKDGLKFVVIVTSHLYVQDIYNNDFTVYCCI